MYRRSLLKSLWIGVALLLTSAAFASATSPQLQYHVEIGNLAQKTLHIQLKLTAPPADKTAFEIPAWTPGYYQILHYEKKIANLSAKDDKKNPLTLTHPTPRRWEVSNPNHVSSLNVEYDLTADDSGYGFFGSSLLPNTGYINGASAFLYPAEYKEAKISLTMSLPTGWQVATGLDTASQRAKSPSTFSFQAENYDQFIDCPIQFGKFDTFHFTVSRTPFQCVLVGDHKVNTPQFQKNLTTVALEAEKILGRFPFKRYVFLFHCGGGGFGGGLEHRNSTTIHVFGAIGGGGDEGMFPLVSHEFFHAWDVKYIHPEQLGPFDYTKEVRSPNVWFAEGVTDYYAQLLLARANAFPQDWFLRDMAGRIQQLNSTPARKTVTLEEASRKAWEGGSFGFGGLSYYLKGSVVGFYFDLRIRALTEGAKGMDDVLRELDEKYASKGKGYPDDAILTAINNAAGIDLTTEYNAYVRGTDEMMWTQVLKPFGLRLAQKEDGYLGILTSPSASASSPLTLIEVVEGTAAEKMGLKKGDIITHINGTKVDTGNFRSLLQAMKPGAELKAEVKRKAETLTLVGNIGSRTGEITLDRIPKEELTGKEEALLKVLLASPAFYKKD